MLDNLGFISEMNGTNIFMVKNGKLLTPTADACLHGITRGLVLELAREHGMPVEERNLSLTELYSADEAFGTGSMGELTPITEVDGRTLVNRSGNQITQELVKFFEGTHGKWSTPIDKL